jgi:hypothetical protein
MEEANDSSLADFISSYNEKIEKNESIEQRPPVEQHLPVEESPPLVEELPSMEEMVAMMLRALIDGDPKQMGTLSRETGYNPETTESVVSSMHHADLVEVWGESFDEGVVQLVPDWQEKLSN